MMKNYLNHFFNILYKGYVLQTQKKPLFQIHFISFDDFLVLHQNIKCDELICENIISVIFKKM